MAQELSFDEIIESLYNFNQADLRRLAWEALLISDGPDKSAPVGDQLSTIEVDYSHHRHDFLVLEREAC